MEVINKPGIHTRGIIRIVDKKPIILGPIVSDTSPNSRDPFDYSKLSSVLQRHLSISHKDAEVAMIENIESQLYNLPKIGHAYDSISIVILGQVGACNGCHYRIEQAAKRWREAGFSERLTVTNVYSHKPRLVTTGYDIERDYGRAHRAKEFTRKLNLNKDPNRHPPHTYYAEEY